jgi:DNA-binding response OmpR family regulator
MRILLVEDDTSLGQTMLTWLRMDQHAVDWVRRGDAAEAALMAHDYDCVLLDRGLPGVSGDAILVNLRARENPVPVLMITAFNLLAERVHGLDIGADDYLIKPFDLVEMSARIRAVVRRNTEHVNNEIRHRGVELNMVSKHVSVHGATVELTASEFNLLYALMLRKASIMTRKQLEDALYGWGDEVESNAIEVHVHNLRKKLGTDLIVTIRGLGYRLRAEHA